MTTLLVAGAQFLGNAAVQIGTNAALAYANNAISNAFDNRVFEGPRLDSFHLQTSRDGAPMARIYAVSYTHLRAHETRGNLVCRLLLEKKKQK